MSLNKSIINIRVALQNSKLRKSGKNKFAGFEYYELSDFLPKLNELMMGEEVNDLFSVVDNVATLTLIKDEERQNYCMPFIMFDTPKNKNGGDSMQHIQYLGALNTYYKRYLYLNAFGITDGEVIDAIDNTQQYQYKQPQPQASVQMVETLAKTKGVDIAKICEAYKIETISHATSEELNKIYGQLLKK